ncbi:MAG: PDZ domain-containing protein [Deltaproteobacteria bacterium]
MKRLLVFALLFAGCPAKSRVPRDAGVREAPAVELTSEATTYRLTFDGHRQHLVDVQVAVPTTGRDVVTFMMPTWTPGSYLVREYARHVEGVRAFDESGAPLSVEKVRKNRWRIDADGRAGVKLTYRVYARDLSVRGSFVGADFAMLNGASVFVTDVDHLERQHRVRIEHPYAESLTALPRADVWIVADDYDALVDAPILLGRPDTQTFDVDGTAYVLATVGGDDDFDTERAASDVAKLAATQQAFWPGTPFDRYVFMNVLVETGGGLEHGASTVVMGSRFASRDDETYRGWLGVMSHELFHAWNGKRLRPRALGPFDYENEVYTEDLWFVEGFTSYYDDLLLARAGLMTQAQWLGALSKNIERVETRPGRHHQSLAEASYDAWIKFYRPDENAHNTSVSYYSQGAVVAFLADAAIREATRGRRSLDDVMREAYRQYAGEVGFSREALFDVFEAVGGPAVRELVVTMVRTTRPLDYDDAFDFYGIRFAKKDKSESAYLGVEHSKDKVVTEVLRGTPAYVAGIEVGDELIAYDGDRIQGVGRDLTGREPGSKVQVLLSRRRKLRTVEVKLGEVPRRPKVEREPSASTLARRNLEALLTPR